ncbi:hypothetical protein Asp14428_24410 [Actinoplanes sp. NBRC 14428]|nr:hypothetical protein Asp14428_24410 [Actinoplanes sp. NBRC 14428]
MEAGRVRRIVTEDGGGPAGIAPKRTPHQAIGAAAGKGRPDRGWTATRPRRVSGTAAATSCATPADQRRDASGPAAQRRPATRHNADRPPGPTPTPRQRRRDKPAARRRRTSGANPANRQRDSGGPAARTRQTGNAARPQRTGGATLVNRQGGHRGPGPAGGALGVRENPAHPEGPGERGSLVP